MIKLREKDELPREKLLRSGPEYLSDYELLALILRTGTRNKDVLELSKEILENFGMNEVSRKRIEDLVHFDGVKDVKASQIIAIFELARRLASKRPQKKEKLRNSKEVFDLVRFDFMDLDVEKVMLVCVNAKNQVIRKEFIFEGGLDYSVIDIRILFKKILNYNASGFFIIHNHPSGDPNPSSEDVKVTEDISYICSRLNLRFLDHLIVGEEYYSFADNSQL